MTELFSSSRIKLIPRTDIGLREEIFASPQDLSQLGINVNEQYCIFVIQPLAPGPRDNEYAARIIASPQVSPGTLQINQFFLADTGFMIDDERFWIIRSAPNVISIKKVLVEQTMDQNYVDREINNLRHNRNEFFVKRCILVEPKQEPKDLYLRLQGRASLNFRSIEPQPLTLRDRAIFVFDEYTQINLFIPHRKSGVDIVVIVDGSGSMDLFDFVYEGRNRTRLEGVKIALDILFQTKLVSGSRVSSIAAIAFGKNAEMLYPFEVEMRKLVDESEMIKIRESIRLINDVGLKKLGVDRDGTVISNALKLGSDLLDLYAQENNEKVIILLSDGADWTEDTKDEGFSEVVQTSQDPAVLADNMHDVSDIRIHTIAISDEDTFLRFYPQQRGKVGYVPNIKLLKKIAVLTDGMFLESPTADQLSRIFEDLGVGTIYPINEK